MSKNKNFEIIRNKHSNFITVSDISIGDMFERQGSLHMRVLQCQNPCDDTKVSVCNMNTGSVWNIDANDEVFLVKNCSINYDIEL